MADSTVFDISKLKVVELRKELKSRGLPTIGDKSELVARLQAAMSQDHHDEHGDINLDSDEIDSDGVLEDDDDKSQTDILEDATLNEELALADQPSKPPAEEPKPARTFKRKITSDSVKPKADEKTGEKEPTAKKIVLNRPTSITAPAKAPEGEQQKEKPENKPIEAPTESSKVKITADIDAKTRLELRAKRFGLPVKMNDSERKEARMKRFGQATGNSTVSSGTLTENLDKLKQRAERFGQSVSKIMTDIENKEKLEKRKAKFGTA